MLRHALVPLLLLALLPGCVPRPFAFASPPDGLVSAPGDVGFQLDLPPLSDVQSLVLHLDGQPLPASSFAVIPGGVAGTLSGLAAGSYELEAWVGAGEPRHTRTRFDLVSLDRPDECEILNQVECLLPYPSSRFEEPASTETGVRIAYGPTSLPVIARLFPTIDIGPADPTPFLENDGFSPTVQVLMHFEPTPDPVRSEAPRIVAATRTYTEKGLRDQSPTLLIDWETGERKIHWIENDGTTTDSDRIVTFLRPGASLTPGKRYLVAVRRLVDGQGNAIEPEPVFRAIRDGAPSDLPAVEARRQQLEPVLRRLDEVGVPRGDLQLAFDFQVQSDASLTRELVSMRDQAFAWLDAQRAAGLQTFQVDDVDERNPGCTDPAEPVWRFVEGTFQAPLFLGGDPFVENTEVRNLVRGPDGLPVWSTTTDAPFGIGIPCDVFDAAGGFSPLPPIVIGHGLFGEGPGTADGVAGSALAPGLIPGGTNWVGMSGPDTRPSLPQSFIFKVTVNPDLVQALPDRLRQGQVHALLLARMMREGDFNRDPAFQGPGGTGALLENDEIYYWGASLGGIMGHLFAALTPDVERLVLDVPAINFSLLLQRATPFLQFEQALDLVIPDRMNQAIGIGLSHELWARGDPAGYATHITRDPLPGSIAKKILLHVALHDQQVSNLGSQLAGATLGLPVHESSAMQDLAGMPSSKGPQDSAYMVIDTAAFDLDDPAHLPFVPPLFNDQAVGNRCDPHNRLRVTPAALDQISLFLRPGGRIETTCTDNGVCDASSRQEFPFGVEARCDPLL